MKCSWMSRATRWHPCAFCGLGVSNLVCHFVWVRFFGSRALIFLGGICHPWLNIVVSPIAYKYREGKMKSTLKREWKACEIAEKEAIPLQSCFFEIIIFAFFSFFYFILYWVTWEKVIKKVKYFFQKNSITNFFSWDIEEIEWSKCSLLCKLYLLLNFLSVLQKKLYYSLSTRKK